jgi:hypothetical protein
MQEIMLDNTAIIDDIKKMIVSGRKAAYDETNKAMITTYWNIGRRIVEEEQHGKQRAEYGGRLIEAIAEELTREFGNGFSSRNLRNCRKFYQYFPDAKIWNACVPNLTWTHFRSLLRVPDENARIWYMRESSEENWSSRTLDRNIGTQYYYRLLKSPTKDDVIAAAARVA